MIVKQKVKLMRKLTFLLACLFLVGVGLVNAQSRTVTGKVIYAEDEQPVIGAYVVVQGTSRGTVTDADGGFSISVPQEASILEFSFLGLQTVQAEARNGMVVRMEQGVSELDEVMVVAFGTATKKSFTGSAAVINEEMIEKVQSSNVTNNLAGRIAGVQALTSNGQPGTGSSIRIRGIGSMNSSNAPLYVVDGVPYDSDISAISNSDIESVTVLKDASSAALYGSRGANGVVIITTKKGKFSGKDAQVRVETKWGSNSRAVPTYQIMTDPGMYYETFYRALYNSRVNSFGDQAAHEYANKVLLDASNGGLGYQVYSIPEGERLVGTNFKLNPNAIEGYSDGTYTYLADNWFNEVFKKDNLRQEYNLSVNGSSDKLTYFASGNFLDDTGIIENSDYQRFSARLNTDYQAKEWLKFVTNVSYVRTDSRYPDDQVSDRSSGNIFYLSNMLAPIYPLYIRDSNGQIMKDANNYTMYDYGDGTIVNAKRPFMSQSNPASMLMLNTEKFSTDFFVGKWSVVAEIFKGLKATATIGVTSANEKYNMLMNPYYGQFADGGGYVAVSSGRFFSLNKKYFFY
jgi:TonB-linked SusC/RagA family outer membrane protein